MKYWLTLTDDAQFEETEACNYYEDSKPGLGESFLTKLNNGYNKVTEYPFYYSYLMHSKVLRNFKIETFPYIVIYLVSGNNITVVSVRNTHRHPFI